MGKCLGPNLTGGHWHEGHLARKIFNKVNRYARPTSKADNLITSDDDILAILGPREPGSYDIYCVRPSQANPNVDEVVNLLTANVSFQLCTRVEPIYTL